MLARLANANRRSSSRVNYKSYYAEDVAVAPRVAREAADCLVVDQVE